MRHKWNNVEYCSVCVCFDVLVCDTHTSHLLGAAWMGETVRRAAVAALQMSPCVRTIKDVTQYRWINRNKERKRHGSMVVTVDEGRKKTHTAQSLWMWAQWKLGSPSESKRISHGPWHRSRESTYAVNADPRKEKTNVELKKLWGEKHEHWIWLFYVVLDAVDRVVHLSQKRPGMHVFENARATNNRHMENM